MNFLTLLLFVLGLAILIGGAEMLVRGAARLAEAAGIPPLVVGLTVVAYGTSAPELAVSMRAAFENPPQPDLAVGNVVGSNIANILLVLGLSATISPLLVSRQVIRVSVPLMIGISLLLSVVGWNEAVGRGEGWLLVAGAVAYTCFEVVRGRRSLPPATDADGGRRPAGSRRQQIRDTLICLVLMVVGLGLLVQGAHWLVQGASTFARWLGVPELVIGLTVVAVGTSLPEIATSVVAAVRGQRAIAVGNVVGSNIFNILLVLGLSAAVAPEGLTVSPMVRAVDIPVMIGTAIICLPIFYTGHTIARWEGLLLLSYYGCYTLYLILYYTEHPALVGFSRWMLLVILPLSGLLLLLTVIFARLRPIKTGLEDP
ncbi:MAG: calcium/sodium antiporter [Pirellulaceae bacterium]|nr:calcium/sodium antiporter [Pirellulaceae bacterium]